MLGCGLEGLLELAKGVARVRGVSLVRSFKSFVLALEAGFEPAPCR